MFKKKPAIATKEKQTDAQKPPRHAVGEPSTPPKSGFAVVVSRGFTKWLSAQNASLAVTTYKVGKILFFGTDQENGFWTYNRNIGRCLGLAAGENGFWVTSDHQLYRFENLLRAGQRGQGGCDAYFAPRATYFTGDLDIHDLALTGDGDPVFINTLFNCLAKPSDKHSFEPIWQPPFISGLIAEDRCHLNGLAMKDGEPRFVTMVSQTDVYDGWRGHRDTGGIIMDVTTNEVVCEGLSMPHSPRWHEGKLWLHNSGTGDFGYVDFDTKRFVPIAFCPGYLRGLDFLNGHAVVGLSLPRGNKTFTGLSLDERLSQQGVEPRSGIYIIDLNSGAISHSLIFQGVVTELYDVAVLSNVRQPGALSPLGNEVGSVLSIPG